MLIKITHANHVSAVVVELRLSRPNRSSAEREPKTDRKRMILEGEAEGIRSCGHFSGMTSACR